MAREPSSFTGSMPKTPRKKRKQRTLITSPYFSPTRPKRSATAVTKCDIPMSPTIRSTKKAEFMTFESKLPLGPEIDVNTESTIVMSNEDVEWYTAQFKMFDNPSFAFNLRKSTYLNFALYSSKPNLIQGMHRHRLSGLVLVC